MQADAVTTWAPWSCEAEQSALGSLMLDNDVVAAVSGLLDSSAFWQPAHRTIFHAVSKLVGRGQPADPLTVFEHLRDCGIAEDCGGLEYLEQLAQSVPSAAHARRYAQIVADKAQRRALLRVQERAAAIIREAETAEHALEQLQTEFDSLKRLRAHSGPRRLGDILVDRASHWDALNSGDILPGISTGLPPLDNALGGGIKPGKVIVLAARPSIGKTSLAQSIGMTVAQHETPVLMLSQEMQAGELADRAAATLSGVDLGTLTTGQFGTDDWAAVLEASEQAAKLPFFVDDQPALSLLDIRTKAREVKRRHGLGLVVVDYLQLCATTGAADKRHHQIEQISRGIKALAKELEVSVMLLSQLKRSTEEEPELDHLKESGAIEEDADVVILLHPMGNEPDGSQLVLAKVAKNRGGRRGRIALSFHGQTQHWAPSTGNVARRGRSTR